MQEAIKTLKHAEEVLMKRIKVMKDGKPKYAASEKLRELRDAIHILKQVNMEDEFAKLESIDEDALLQQMFTQHPPHAKA